jgi:hypothetical protein
MSKGPISRRWWLLCAIVIVAVVAVVYHCLPPTPLTPHTGDGEFTDISWRGRVFFLPMVNIRGFAVSMPPFDLGQD